jgi:hypothetical protein
MKEHGWIVDLRPIGNELRVAWAHVSDALCGDDYSRVDPEKLQRAAVEMSEACASALSKLRH